MEQLQNTVDLFERYSPQDGEVELNTEDTVKALGVVWNAREDVIKFSVKDTNDERLTKRIILSRISGIYDQFGLSSVVTIGARVAIQEVWRSKQYGWNDPLPAEICEHWSKLFEDISDLRKVKFPRSLKPKDVCGPAKLHVFCDASGSAYGAVAFILWPTVGGPYVRFVTAKARVAPLHQTTIPRLELMGARVASRLAKPIVDKFKENPGTIVLWTESQIVLRWLQFDSIKLKAFVGVLVSEIQRMWDPDNWRFVLSKWNPADDLSRGLQTHEMLGRWMSGPPFL